MVDTCTNGVDTGFAALSYAKVAALGVLQGITELLPISSTAHMLRNRSSKNSKANRIETGERSGGIRRNLFGGSRRKIAKKIANHRPRNAVKRRRRAIDQKAMLSTLR